MVFIYILIPFLYVHSLFKILTIVSMEPHSRKQRISLISGGVINNQIIPTVLDDNINNLGAVIYGLILNKQGLNVRSK